MAITGTGTELDPYIVHDYTELLAIQQGKGTYWQSGNVDIYINLTSDIDMAGVSWVDPSANGEYVKFHLDLGGHTWSNISLTGTDRLFYGVEIENGTFDGISAHEMKNSVFMCNYNIGLALHDLTIKNLECDYVPESGYDYYYEDCYAFFRCGTIERCNIDVIMHFPDETQVRYGTNYNGYSVFYNCTAVQYCDIHAVCDGNHSYYENATSKTSRQGIFKSVGTVQYCRITGSLTDSDVPITEFINRDRGLNYCVVDFDFSACTLADSSVDCGLSVVIGGTSTSTVMNTDSLDATELYDKYTAGTGVIDCTYSEIRSYAALTEKSFPVTPTGETPPAGWIWLITNGYLPYLENFDPPPAPSGLYIGDYNIQSLYVGDTAVSKVYRGNTKIL